MTKIFKSRIDFLEHRLSDAAHGHAKEIVEKLKKSAYANGAGFHFPHNSSESKFWLEAITAHREALLAEVSSEIERYGIELMKRKAAEWEQTAKGSEK